VLDFAQTRKRARGVRATAQKHRKQAQGQGFPQRGAFRKYNSTIGFIGFPPSARLIIDKSDNLGALSI
jgi:hypothetical protein